MKVYKALTKATKGGNRRVYRDQEPVGEGREWGEDEMERLIAVYA
jgi:hypothetical protein